MIENRSAQGTQWKETYMHPGLTAAISPDHPAYIMAETKEVVSYRELEERSNQYAQLFRSLGLTEGDGVAIFLENHPRFLEICWGAQRSGLYYTPISYRLQLAEVEYIVKNCDAKVFITSAHNMQVATGLSPLLKDVACFMLDDVAEGFKSLEAAAATMPVTPIDNETEGRAMLYSSGTTGQPKGIRHALSGQPFGTRPAGSIYGLGNQSRYLSPAPLYHSAPLASNMSVTRLGGTSIIMENFDAEWALELIAQYRITIAQWVPTMFVRMLKLPPEVRAKYDMSSIEVAVHAAAPCPVPVKHEMIEWWGPVLEEYYAGTEGIGTTRISSAEWLAHPGSVGKPENVEIRILDDDGNALPAGQSGTIWFAGDASFEYYKDPEKTAAARNTIGSTLGDIGYLDEEGYLYLTDRKANMIISGGVNIYPQETENVLVTHAKVRDVAVIGVPNEDFGEEVKAIVEPMDWEAAGPDLEQELIAFCRANISAIKCPRTIDFEQELPRHPTGKLYKRLLKDKYWEGHETRIQ